jgi:hypothetical protein
MVDIEDRVFRKLERFSSIWSPLSHGLKITRMHGPEIGLFYPCVKSVAHWAPTGGLRSLNLIHHPQTTCLGPVGLTLHTRIEKGMDQ